MGGQLGTVFGAGFFARCSAFSRTRMMCRGGGVGPGDSPILVEP